MRKLMIFATRHPLISVVFVVLLAIAAEVSFKTMVAALTVKALW